MLNLLAMILYGLKLTLVGMLVVFLFLILLGFAISLLGKLLNRKKDGAASVAAAAAAVHSTRS